MRHLMLTVTDRLHKELKLEAVGAEVSMSLLILKKIGLNEEEEAEIRSRRKGRAPLARTPEALATRIGHLLHRLGAIAMTTRDICQRLQVKRAELNAACTVGHFKIYRIPGEHAERMWVALMTPQERKELADFLAAKREANKAALKKEGK